MEQKQLPHNPNPNPIGFQAPPAYDQHQQFPQQYPQQFQAQQTFYPPNQGQQVVTGTPHMTQRRRVLQLTENRFFQW